MLQVLYLCDIFGFFEVVSLMRRPKMHCDKLYIFSFAVETILAPDNVL